MQGESEGVCYEKGWGLKQRREHEKVKEKETLWGTV